MKLITVLLAFFLSLGASGVRAESQPATMSETGLWKFFQYDDSTAVPWAQALLIFSNPGGLYETGKYYDDQGGYGLARYFSGVVAIDGTGSTTEPNVSALAYVKMAGGLKRADGSWAGGVTLSNAYLQKTAGWQCPASGGWLLEGQTCTRPDCPAGKKMQPDGTCKSVCEPSDGILQDGYIAKPLSQTYCNGQCEYYYQVVMESGAKGDDSHYDFTAGGVAWTYGTYRQKWPGTACTDVRSPGEPPGGPKPPVPRKKPPCADGEGVLTTSAGHVGCVPEGVPDARKPDVKKESKNESFPDGSQKQTDTVTTRDPATGATESSQSVSTSAGPGGGTQAGTPGVSTSSSSSSSSGGSGSGDGTDKGAFCSENPANIICKQGAIKDRGKYSNDQEGRLTEAKAQLTAKFAEIRTALSGQLHSNGGTGGGSLPCPAPLTVMGASISFCVADYSASLSVIGDIIVFAATIIAAIIVVTS